MTPFVLLVLAGPAAFALGAMVLWTAPGLLGTRPSFGVRAVLSLVSGALALLLPPSPTGLAGVDALMRVALVGVLTFVVSRAGARWVLGSALLAAGLAWGSPLHVVALAAAGVMAALFLTSSYRTLATIVIAAATIHVALQLEWPRAPHGATAIAALVVLAPMVWSGSRRAQSPERRREQYVVSRAAAVVGLLAIGFGMLGLLAVLAARPSIEQAVDQARDGLVLARRPDPDAARERLEAAERSFTTGHRWLDAWWVRPAWAVPVVGQHLRALRSVTVAGVDLAEAGTKVASSASLDGLMIEDGQLPVDRIAAVTPAVDEAFGALDSAVRSLRAADSPWLLPSFDRRLSREVQRLVEARATAARTHDALQVLPALLGASEPRRYFLLVQTPSELRGTGGFMGNFGEITAVGGKLSLERFGRTHELNPSGPPASSAQRTISGPADYVARYSRFAPATTWQNVTMSPDFPSVAKVVGELYPQSGGRAVDGVLALDPAGVAALLQLTGPVTVEGWPEPLTASNAERVLLHEQYVRFGDGATADRVDFLGDAARTVWSRLTTGALPPLDRVARALGPAVAQKRIMFASLRPLESDVVSSLGVSGAMKPVDGDFLGVVAQNASGSKIDWFLRRSIDYSVAVGDGGGVSATATVTLRNEAPASGLPPVIIGSATTPPLPMGTSRLYVSVYSPWGLSGATLNGEAVNLESEDELGRNVYSTFVDLPPGGTATLVLRLTGHYESSSGRYALTLHRQPAVAPDDVRIEGTAGVRRAVRLTEDERLEGDRVAR